MRIMLLCSSFNGLTQRASIELAGLGHKVGFEQAGPPAAMIDAVRSAGPDLILCPYLTHRVPSEIWSRYRTIIIHPGPIGDRGPSSLDWAISERAEHWGVTALQAVDELDAGPIWAGRTFAMPAGAGSPAGPRKSELYNGLVADLAMELIREVVAKAADPDFRPEPAGRGVTRPLMRQSDRAFDWSQDPAEIVRRIRAADGAPGVRTQLCGMELSVFDAHLGQLAGGRGTRGGVGGAAAGGSGGSSASGASGARNGVNGNGGSSGPAISRGEPGTIAARKHGAVLVRAGDGGAVWIGRAKAIAEDGRLTVKLPATEVLWDHLAHLPVPNHSALFDSTADGKHGFREITYRRLGSIGRLTFDFYNGAMSTAQCRRLYIALRYAIEQDTAALVFEGGPVFSNGIDLNSIEASVNPALEAWRNINAIDDICREIITCTRQPLIAAISGNAGAGGVMLALGAHRVAVRTGSVLNPHYATMGLYGSEYWTYTLPHRIGGAAAARLTTACRPLGASEAVELGLADHSGPAGRCEFDDWLVDYARGLAAGPGRERLLEAARARRQADEQRKPLAAYRAEELAEMSQDMFVDRNGFAAARAAFVHKGKHTSRQMHAPTSAPTAAPTDAPVSATADDLTPVPA